MTDRFDLANAIEAAGSERKAAENIAGMIFDAIGEPFETPPCGGSSGVATKADLSELRAELKADIAAVQADLPRLEARGDLVEHRL